jgi:hypothetical protein
MHSESPPRAAALFKLAHAHCVARDTSGRQVSARVRRGEAVRLVRDELLFGEASVAEFAPYRDLPLEQRLEIAVAVFAFAAFDPQA